MGFFDVVYTHPCKSQKESLNLEEKVAALLLQEGFEKKKAEGTAYITYQAPKSPLKYHLTFSHEKNDFILFGELQQTLIIAILIILAILLTYGIGVVIVVGYLYYQKVQTTKQLTSLIKKAQGTSFA